MIGSIGGRATVHYIIVAVNTCNRNSRYSTAMRNSLSLSLCRCHGLPNSYVYYKHYMPATIHGLHPALACILIAVIYLTFIEQGIVVLDTIEHIIKQPAGYISRILVTGQILCT